MPVEPAHDNLPALHATTLELPGLRKRFGSNLSWRPEIISDRSGSDNSPARPAAVLVPLIAGSTGTEVLLTTRPSTLRSHSGQIAFPGGSVDSGDTDRIATALREAREEVGLQADDVQVLGQLPEYLTGSGFAVTPVIGWVHREPELVPDPIEVDEVFRVPLAFLMDPANHQRRRYTMDDGNKRSFYTMPWLTDATRSGEPANPAGPASTQRIEYFIWGVTAAIIRNIYHYLRAGT